MRARDTSRPSRQREAKQTEIKNLSPRRKRIQRTENNALTRRRSAILREAASILQSGSLLGEQQLQILGNGLGGLPVTRIQAQPPFRVKNVSASGMVDVVMPAFGVAAFSVINSEFLRHRSRFLRVTIQTEESFVENRHIFGQ